MSGLKQLNQKTSFNTLADVAKFKCVFGSGMSNRKLVTFFLSDEILFFDPNSCLVLTRCDLFEPKRWSNDFYWPFDFLCDTQFLFAADWDFMRFSVIVADRLKSMFSVKKPVAFSYVVAKQKCRKLRGIKSNAAFSQNYLTQFMSRLINCQSFNPMAIVYHNNHVVFFLHVISNKFPLIEFVLVGKWVIVFEI